VSSSAHGEAVALQYTLRAVFYVQRSRELARAWSPARLSPAEKRSLDWDNWHQMGVSSAAWELAQKTGIDPSTVFCHPHLFARLPACLAYYAQAAALSKKGISALVRARRPGGARNADPALRVRVVNEHISRLIESEPGFLTSRAAPLRTMSFGAEVNGSWRNRIGRIGSALVKKLILNHFLGSSRVARFVTTNRRKTRHVPRDLDDLKTIVLVNGYTIEFASEPDVSIRSPDGTLDVAMEVKAGLDPAGALERYGACKKSFDRAFEENRAVHTIYLASCMTPAVKRAIESDRLVRAVYDLEEIISSADKRREFLNELTWRVHL